MRGGALPPALLFAALGLALAFAPRRTLGPALAIAALSALAASFVPVPPTWREAAFLACWASVAAIAATVHLPGGPGPRLALGLATLAGGVAGALTSVAGERIDLVKSLPAALLCIPAYWLVGRKGGIAVKVVASWLIAVALLAASLPLTTKTPGYAPDHMD